jgi:hypothetical protein
MNSTPDSLFSYRWGPGLLALLEILLVVVTFVLAAKTEIVRDTDTPWTDFRERPFSLAKSQLAFWTVVVLGCFLYVFFSTGHFSGLMNNTVLWLLGISSGTAALSAAAGGPAVPATTPASTPAPAQPQKHQRFFTDILSDQLGMNIHRLQMLIWTVVFGGIFVYVTIKSGVFPTFDDQAFVLMGISSATYVWFKRSEV